MSDITFADLISKARTHDVYWKEIVSEIQNQIELEVYAYLNQCLENDTEANYWAIFEIISRIIAPYEIGIGGGSGNSI